MFVVVGRGAWPAVAGEHLALLRGNSPFSEPSQHRMAKGLGCCRIDADLLANIIPCSLDAARLALKVCWTTRHSVLFGDRYLVFDNLAFDSLDPGKDCLCDRHDGTALARVNSSRLVGIDQLSVEIDIGAPTRELCRRTPRYPSGDHPMVQDRDSIAFRELGCTEGSWQCGPRRVENAGQWDGDDQMHQK